MSTSLAKDVVSGLVTRVPRDHHEPVPELRRRRLVVAATGLAGSGLLRRSLSRPPGSAAFYGHAAAVAATWAAGGLASGPLHLGRERGSTGRLRRPVAVPVVTGLAAFAGFYGCALA
ncbi:MAG: hypothetical protein WCD35_18960, partial [Mycobacteriales bacterium]